jgi:RNA-directed DNA polymerase
MARWRNTAAALASAFLAGMWELEEMVARGEQTLEPAPRWLRAVASDVLNAYRDLPTDRPRELERFIELRLRRLPPGLRPPRVRRWLLFEQEMAPLRWEVPPIGSSGELADVLGVTAGELEWLVDGRALERTVTTERLRNYRYAWLPRTGRPPRLIEQPKARLKAIQRRVLHELLDPIPAHDAAHGFRRGYSAHTGAAAHTGRRVVLRFDLEDFFASVRAGRVYGIFRTAGYPETVAYALTGLCTNVAPRHVTDSADIPYRLSSFLRTPHLPQGAPTSPALANLCAYRLDRRLSGLAAKLGATYTRYADDLAFSANSLPDIAPLVAEIAREEGFQLNERKTRAMPRSSRQRVYGIVVNERPNVSRPDYDLLKATLHNVARRGPAAENRAGVPDFRAHLLGRISWVESLNPARGAKLRRAFAQIDWS